MPFVLRLGFLSLRLPVVLIVAVHVVFAVALFFLFAAPLLFFTLFASVAHGASPFLSLNPLRIFLGGLLALLGRMA